MQLLRSVSLKQIQILDQNTVFFIGGMFSNCVKINYSEMLHNKVSKHDVDAKLLVF